VASGGEGGGLALAREPMRRAGIAIAVVSTEAPVAARPSLQERACTTPPLSSCTSVAAPACRVTASVPHHSARWSGAPGPSSQRAVASSTLATLCAQRALPFRRDATTFGPRLSTRQRPTRRQPRFNPRPGRPI